LQRAGLEEVPPGHETDALPLSSPFLQPRAPQELPEDAYAAVVESLCSPQFHSSNIHGDDFEMGLDQIIEAGVYLDSIKKILFYGREPECPVPSYVPSFNYDRVHPNIVHGILGIITEACELAERLLKMGKDPSDPAHALNLLEEMGDLRWYYQLLLNTLYKTDGEVCLTNARKLFRRYPEKVFAATRAAERDLIAEEKALKGE
jgi:NTP pyrophosphatase (non-canonical NTP hydrolase)